MRQTLTIVLLLLGLVASVYAQDRVMKIRLLDPSCEDAPVKGAKVKIEGNRTFSRSFKSDSDGWIIAKKLPESTYKLTVSKYGFKVHIIRDIKILDDTVYFEQTYKLQRGYWSSDPNINDPNYEPCKH